MYEYPPILSGSEQNQLNALRDYLVRMAKSLEAAERAEAAAQTAPSQTGRKEQEDKLASIRRNAANLRALIVKTAADADTLAVELGAAREEMQSYYLAKSDFGAYMEQVESTFAAS